MVRGREQAGRWETVVGRAMWLGVAGAGGVQDVLGVMLCDEGSAEGAVDVVVVCDGGGFVAVAVALLRWVGGGKDAREEGSGGLMGCGGACGCKGTGGFVLSALGTEGSPYSGA